MANLRLGALVDDRPVKLTVELSAAVHRELLSYAAAHAAENGQPRPQPEKLVGPMLSLFMAEDREFAKSKREGRGVQPAGS